MLNTIPTQEWHQWCFCRQHSAAAVLNRSSMFSLLDTPTPPGTPQIPWLSQTIPQPRFISAHIPPIILIMNNMMVKSPFWLVHMPTMSGNWHQPRLHFGSFLWLHLPSILIGKSIYRCIQHHIWDSKHSRDDIWMDFAIYGFSQTSIDGLITSRDFLLPCSVPSHRIPGPRPMYSSPAASESFSPLRLEVMVQWWLMLHYRVDLKMGDPMITWLLNRKNGDSLTRKMLMNLINIEKLSILGAAYFRRNPWKPPSGLSTPRGSNHTGGSHSDSGHSWNQPLYLIQGAEISQTPPAAGHEQNVLVKENLGAVALFSYTFLASCPAEDWEHYRCCLHRLHPGGTTCNLASFGFIIYPRNIRLVKGNPKSG